MVRLVATTVQRMRSVHDRSRRFVLLDISWRVSLDISIAVHNRRVVLAHRCVARGGDAFAATRVLGGSALHDPNRLAHWLAHGSVVPCLSFILARRSRNFLRTAIRVMRKDLQWLRDVLWLLVVEVAMGSSHGARGSRLSIGWVLRPRLTWRS
jgi:hypothetical protein